MSHEIRTPLNAILGFVDTLGESEKDPDKNRYLHLIKNSSKTLLLIINDILDFSKIESGKLDLEYKTFDPQEEFGPLLHLYDAHCRAKGLRFDAYVDPLLPQQVRSDALRIKQILANLLSNALKFTENGGISISIRHENGIVFDVADTGIGIDEAHREKIFDAFSQADSSTTRRFGGTGLGLSISLQLAGMLGGSLMLAESSTRGSRFRLRLPLSTQREETQKFAQELPTYDEERFKELSVCILADTKEPTKTETLESYLGALHVGTVFRTDSIAACECDLLILDASLADASLQKRLDSGLRIIIHDIGTDSCTLYHGKYAVVDCFTGATHLQRLIDELFVHEGPACTVEYGTGIPLYRGRVLVVEDYETNQMLMEVLLEARGLDFDFADNGAEAVERYTQKRYDLILMDENMPVMNGSEATRQIIALEKERGLPHVPVVAVTANAVKGDRERFEEAGMDDYISKPVEADKLDAVLSRFLEKKEAGTQAG